MQLSRTKFRKSFILSTKKWIKCFPGKNPVDSREKSGDIMRCSEAWVAEREREAETARELEDAALASRASSNLKIYCTHWLTDDLSLFVSRFIKLIGLAKVAAVVGLRWNFTARLLQCLLHETINSPNSIHKWIHYRNPSYDFLNT